jgi:hypothetical protein
MRMQDLWFRPFYDEKQGLPARAARPVQTLKS